MGDVLRPIRQRRGSSPDTKLGIIRYGDEISVDDELQKASRKVECIYSSLEELGSLLSCEDVWFELCTIRSAGVVPMADGAAHLLATCLRQSVEPAGHSFRTGCTLRLAGEDQPRLVSGDVKVLVADADAIRKFSAWKGTSGHKCCLECQNVVDFRSPYSHDTAGKSVPHTELYAAKFTRATTIWLS